MDRWVGKVAVVTGASIGIGAAIAEALVREGVLVVGLARRLDKLEELSASLESAKGKLYPKRCDVSKKDDLLNAFEWVKSELGGVDILVNNAGVYSNTKLIDDTYEGFRKLLDVNILATAVSIREAIASMRSRGVAGHIININSQDGQWLPPNENASLYAPTKQAITAITETVRQELVAEGTRIKITDDLYPIRVYVQSVSPGYVKTDIMRAADMPDHEHFFDKIPYLLPKDIADGVLYILGAPEYVQVTELSLRPVGEKH